MRFSIIASAFALLVSPAIADEAVTINFAADVGGKPFSCAETFPDIGSGKTTMSVTDFRLFVHDAALVRADGSLAPISLEQDGQWQYENAALLDFEDGTAACSSSGNSPTNTSLRGTVEDGEYVGLAFTIGLPFELNHVDPTVMPAPLNTTGMFWNWQFGFRFMQVNMVPVVAETAMAGEAMGAGHGEGEAHASHGEGDAHAGHGGGEAGTMGWFLHLGSTLCAANSQTEAPTSPCANPNLVTVLFPEFDPASNVVVLDPGPVVAEADMTVNAPETAPGCMSFPGDADCLTVMTKLGLEYDGVEAGEQLFATVR
ncbi:MbnP family copper-binding protein [Devosia sp. 63-57]|uniref:MbnP family copper-binding protein n=1 Tax=Devosia sp. 63-57 TaxID=1895751 RepID=UPI00086B21C3|nr:MbnP family copper-binding protein [Devosia sp. 63-57]ODT51030.1 MAG: metallo-mystery pair system four-Cys motif protein [Pelagibacterium sp. SCN 63-126]ODU84558.1 MAG: metallo-mystery pair system four-Cys motif protein [Pelagibacterium sp. SCN 63-17]OJX44311.1 MAG: metallo-mystery pair system four-Cys motif protein [Devosia sp. 63-57]